MPLGAGVPAVSVPLVARTLDTLVDAASSLDTDAAELVELEGITHAQVGDYGEQPGDGTPVFGDVRARRAIARASTPLIERVADAQ